MQPDETDDGQRERCPVSGSHGRRILVGRKRGVIMRFVQLAAVTLGLAAAVSWPQAQESGWELVVLGVAQDAGSPQLGCQQDLCVERRTGKRPVERVSSLGLIHRPSGTAYVFDATPDLPSQLHSLTGGKTPAGIFLTHGHVGHYTGLMYLGRESGSASKVPVHATDRLWSFLSTNGPWSQLVTLGNIVRQQLWFIHINHTNRQLDAPDVVKDGARFVM